MADKTENRGLIFIPDISGFTKFVTETEISHSRRIIQELLEILINANRIGLEISEIEGDAILFYKFGEAPEIRELYDQVKKMFIEFHRYLAAYDAHRFCQCKACMSAINLTLKIVSHYGEFTSYSVKNFNKLLGKDVIVAHRLLKNEIEQHEYWLVTKSLLGNNNLLPNFSSWMEWNSSDIEIESGEISFHYTMLSRLKKELPPESSLELELPDKIKALSFSREYDAHIITMLHAAGDVNYRPQWQEGVKKVEETGHFLPRVGMKSRRILDNGEVTMFSSSYVFQPERIEFSETDENKESSTYFILEKISENRTKLTVDIYIRKNIINQLSFGLFKKASIRRNFEKSLFNLEKLAKEIHVASEY